MGKKTKKTKWRTLEITPGTKYKPAVVPEDGDSPALATAATTTTTTLAAPSANGRCWDEGPRRSSYAGNYPQQHHHYHQPGHHHHNHHHQNGHHHPSYERPGYRRRSSLSPAVSAGDVRNGPARYSSAKEESKTSSVEDEYTKITTPRQDVLFKKGYLTRRKVLPETVSENSVDQTSDDIAQDCSNNEDFSNFTNGDESVSQFVCPNPQSYMDPSALFYGGGSYEIFDPYTGNVTVVVGPPNNQYPASNNSCQPILTSVPCRPVPLQPVQWFNPVPSSDWCCSYSPQDKRYSTDSQNGSGVGSESSGVPESPPEIVDETVATNGPVFPPSYVYPGYMFGAPIYNVDGVNVQYYAPPSPELSSTTEQTASKRRKKRKRRRRTGETEEESESSVDDNCNRSISSAECILDFKTQIAAALDYDEEAPADGARLAGASPSSLAPADRPPLYSSLPHGVVDAPEFVPAEYSAQCAPPPAALSGDWRSSRGNSPAAAADYAPKATGAAGLNVYCKPFDGARGAKHDSERGSSSNNSDSGISSPGSEDTSKREFRPKEAKGGASATGVGCAVDDKFKKPRARRSSKPQSAKYKYEEAPAIALKSRQIGAAPKTAPGSKPSRRGGAKEARLRKKAEGVAQVFDCATEAPGCETIVELTAQVTADRAEPADRIAGDEEANERLTAPEVESPSKGCSSACANGVCIRDIEDDCKLPCDIASPAQNDCATMLNEYVQIQEQPVLAKLIDLELVCGAALDDLSISEYASCRENAGAEATAQVAPTPPPRRRRPNRRCVESAAVELVDEVIACARRRVLACDNQLPVTLAVTKWLNDHGGLPAVSDKFLSAERKSRNGRHTDEESDEEVAQLPKVKKAKQNCVIC